MDLDIWRLDRGADGAFDVPVHSPQPVNSTGAEWFPRPSADGWLYFGSNRPGGYGGNDIWRARTESGGRWTVENLGPAVNTPGDEYEPLPSADGSRLIEVVDDPARMADGGDPQLERAIEEVMRALAVRPPVAPARPPYPDRHGR